MSLFLPNLTQTVQLHVQMRKARNTCASSCPQSIFLSKTNSQMVCCHRSIFILQIRCLYGACRDSASSLLADVVEISTQTVFALHVLSNTVSPRLFLYTVCENNNGEHMIKVASASFFFFWILG